MRQAIKILMNSPLYWRWSVRHRYGVVKHMVRLLK